jgi:hypothetical protein
MRARLLPATQIALFAMTGVGALTVGSAVGTPPSSDGAPALGADTLRPVAAFADIANPRERATAIFVEMGKVLQHPRCVNCHPAGDVPLQTDSMRPHQPLVVRGAAGHGAPAMGCATCHHKENYEPARVPGHPRWHLAPIEMAWQGKTLTQICEQIKDRRRNGGKTLAQVVHHLGEDSLVGWGWAPGGGRAPAPGTQKELGALAKAWADAGAHCPPG